MLLQFTHNILDVQNIYMNDLSFTYIVVYCFYTDFTNQSIPFYFHPDVW